MTVGKVQIIRPPDTTLSVNVDPSLLGTGYIDLPIDQFFTDHINGADVVLQRLNPTTGAAATTPGLYYLSAAGLSYRTLAWLFAGYSTGAAITNRFQTNFRLPGDYVAGTDLTLHLSSAYVPSVVATAATIGCNTYRNKSTATKQGFGSRSDPADDATWTYNADLITSTSPLTVLKHVTASSEFDDNIFTIDGDNVGFPLTAGNLMQSIFTSVIDMAADAVALYFADFYVTYTRKIN